MTRFILIQFAFAIAIIGAIAAMMFMFFGWLALIAYLFFAGMCLTPAVLKAREILKREENEE